MSKRAEPSPYPWRASTLLAALIGIVDPLTCLLAAIYRIFFRWPASLDHADSPRRRRNGLILVLGGVEGPSTHGASMVRGVLRSGYDGAVALFPWNKSTPLIGIVRNLMSRRHHETQSDLLVEEIRNHARKHPDAPLSLLAQSGGCWIVVRALEKLNGEPLVDSAVLLAASISRGHDMTLASSACQRGLVAVSSPGDWFIIGLCTTLCGTSDRRFGPSGGWLGWTRPAPGFTHWWWRPTWLRMGYIGNHTSSSAQPFVQRVVAPFLDGRDNETDERPPNEPEA